MAEYGPLGELLAHLKRLRDHPHQRLSTSLVEQSRFLLHNAHLQSSHVVELARLTLTLLRTSQDDLESLVRLLSEAVALVTFDDLQASIPVNVVTEGLSSSTSFVQNLALSYLRKAAESPSGAAFVANDDKLVKALVRLFLTSKSADIGGTKVLEVILLLLSVDDPDKVSIISNNGSVGQTNGQGLLWRRIFHDEEVYRLFFHFTAAGGAGHDLNRADITTAQARLLDFISRVAKLRWDAVCPSTKGESHSSSPTRATANAPERSLLRYATLIMVDRTDPLMTNVLTEFLTKLLELKNPAGCSGISSIPAISSPSLEFLVTSGLHQRAVDYYVRSEQFDTLDIQFLGGAQIRYLCTYANLYPQHFLQGAELIRSTINRLDRNLQISGARWAHGSSPVQDLNVLAHLPAIALVEASKSNDNPLLLLPTNPANADAFETLGKIFHGPNLNALGNDGNLVAQADPFSRGSEAASARMLFYQYHDKHPEFWTNIGAAMNVLTMPQAALAAIVLVRSILTAVWAPLPNNTPDNSRPLSLPVEQCIRELCGGNVSCTGIAEVLNAGESAIQSLLAPVKSLGGDAEAAKLAWRIGREKLDLVVLIADLMKKGVGKDEVPIRLWESLGGRIQERIRLDVGGAFTVRTNLVGTLEG